VHALNELNCQELVGLVTDYFEGALPEQERRRFESHLESCPHCVQYLRQMRRTISELHDLRADSIPAPVMEELLKTFRTWKRQTHDE